MNLYVGSIPESSPDCSFILVQGDTLYSWTMTLSRATRIIKFLIKALEIGEFLVLLASIYTKSGTKWLKNPGIVCSCWQIIEFIYKFFAQIRIRNLNARKM